MARFQHILFPTDLSPLCRTFASEVSYVARRMHAGVTLMHVIEGYPHWYGSVLLEAGCTLSPEEMFGEEREVSQAAFHEFEAITGLPVEAVIEGGDPVRTICDYSKEHRVDLIMVPTHGASMLKRILHGAVVPRLLAGSPCAVWTTAHEDMIVPHIPCKRMVVALGFDGESEYMLRTASELATEFGADVRLVHAVEGVEASGNADGLDDFLLEGARRGMGDLQAAAGTDFFSVFRAGRVPSVVAEVASEWAADLVLIGRSSLHKLLGPIRSHAYDIVSSVPCCVLAV